MSKSIVVIDTPNKCNECPLHEMPDDFNKILCVPMQEITNKFADKKPEWCPLKPMPEKREEKSANDVGLRDSGFIDGWNAYRENILSN